MKKRAGLYILFAIALLLLVAGPCVSANAQSGAWVLERIAYQDVRDDDPNYLTSRSYHLSNPEQSGGREALEASVFYAQRSKFKVTFEWGDPPPVIAPGAKFPLTLSLTLTEKNNLGNYNLLASAAATAFGNIYPEPSCCKAGGHFQDAKGNYQNIMSINSLLGTRLQLTGESKAPTAPGRPELEKYTIRVNLSQVGFDPRYYYIYRWAADGKPGSVTVDKGAERSSPDGKVTPVKPVLVPVPVDKDETTPIRPTPDNLALGKPVRMSSQFSGSYPAANGVDGNPGSMFHTKGERNPWWQVDLKSSYALTSIVLHNRSPYADRARTIQVLISQDGKAWTTIYRHNGTDFKDLTVDAGGRSARYVRVQLAEKNYLHLMEVEVFGSGTAVIQPKPIPSPTDIGTTPPVPVPPVQKFNNYNSNVACSYTDRATFTLKEPIQQAQASLWYDFGNVTPNVSYTLMSAGQTIGRGTVKKGDCAAGYTWCHGFIELGDLGPGTYTVVAAPARVCHNVKHDGGNGFIMISGVPKK